MKILFTNAWLMENLKRPARLNEMVIKTYTSIFVSTYTCAIVVIRTTLKHPTTEIDKVFANLMNATTQLRS
jgi:hypothetical protein